MSPRCSWEVKRAARAVVHRRATRGEKRDSLTVNAQNLPAGPRIRSPCPYLLPAKIANLGKREGCLSVPSEFSGNVMPVRR